MSNSIILFSALACILHLNIVSCLDLSSIDCEALTRDLGAESYNDVFLPHEKRCSDFYQCGKGGAAKFTCGEALTFSIRQKNCGHAGNTRCILLDEFLQKKQLRIDTFYDLNYTPQDQQPQQQSFDVRSSFSEDDD